MKKWVTLIIFFLVASNLYAQDITGIWRGYFISGQGLYRQQFKYEIQIEQLKDNALNGVTYSYRTTVFYGKATLRGIYMSKANNVLIQELKLVELKIADNSEACIMTCYLDYSKDGELEVLEGTFTSVNVKSKNDCGSGTVYLEKVPESDFQKEDFIVRHEKEKLKTPQKKSSIAKTTRPKTTTQPGKNNIASTNNTTKKPLASAKKNTGKTVAPVVKNKTPLKKQYKETPAKKDSSPVIVQVPKPSIEQDERPEELPKPKQEIPIPKIIKERENTLVRTIVTTSSEIKIQLYDNGEIDDDTITVYHNNEVIAYKKRLTDKPITLNIKATVDDATHEFVMVADNLGRIPPNTALMVVTTGGKRYELFITSTEQKNAKVIIKFKVPGSDT